MIVTVFRSRLMPGVREDYVARVDRMVEIAATMPGYISHKGFFAEDGERVSIVEFESEEACAPGACIPNTAKNNARRVTFITRTIPCRFARSCARPASNAARPREIAWPRT